MSYRTQLQIPLAVVRGCNKNNSKTNFSITEVSSLLLWQGKELTFDKDESQLQPKRNSENPVFSKVNAEPLIFSTDEDRTYDISSPVPKIRVFYVLRYCIAHEQKDKKTPVVKTRMPQGIKN